MQSQTEIFSKRVGEYMRGDLVVLSADRDIRALVAALTAEKATSAAVVDEAGRLAGIVTEQDVVRRIALRCTGEEPLADVMTAPVVSVASDDYLYVAIAAMRRHGWHHLPVVDKTHRPIGMIVMDDALEVAARGIVQTIERLAHEDSLDGLREVKAAQVEVAASLLEDNVPAPEIQVLLSEVNRDIHRRVIQLELAAMHEAGWGDPPVEFALMIMGSGGRGENFLYPDQDNGFVLDDYPDSEHGRIDAFFIELAERMTRDLDVIGFPLCRGYVMATNPLWRKTLSQWREQLRIWGRRNSFVAIRLADIFFDFRAGDGKVELVQVLRDEVTRIMPQSHGFLQEIQRETEPYDVALGWFNRLITEKDKPEHRGELNLKHTGTLPLVQNVRLLALREGIAETSTLGRIEALAERDVLSADERDYLSGAFRHITLLLLRQQIADYLAGKKVSNYVHPDQLSEREKDMLVDSFKAIGSLLDKVRAEFTADVF
jgi:CBS domain-containing protein